MVQHCAKTKLLLDKIIWQNSNYSISRNMAFIVISKKTKKNKKKLTGHKAHVDCNCIFYSYLLILSCTSIL